MRIFKTKAFSKWASKAGCDDAALRHAAGEMVHGLHDGNLGGNIYKKRVGIEGRGKSGGLRTIVVFAHREEFFFVYGYAKNEQANLDKVEERALKRLAEEFLGYTETGINKALAAGVLEEI